MLNLNEVYCGNCADTLKQVDDESIDMVLTSPPMMISKSTKDMFLILNQ